MSRSRSLSWRDQGAFSLFCSLKMFLRILQRCLLNESLRDHCLKIHWLTKLHFRFAAGDQSWTKPSNGSIGIQIDIALSDRLLCGAVWFNSLPFVWVLGPVWVWQSTSFSTPSRKREGLCLGQVWASHRFHLPPTHSSNEQSNALGKNKIKIKLK